MEIKSKELTQIALAAALICGFSLITIPLPFGVPITLQTFIIPYVAIVLGSKKGASAVIIYILIGAIGLPVFSGFNGGFPALFGVTGGFILSFPIFAWIVGKGADKNSILSIVLHLIVGGLFMFSCGAVFFAFVSGASLKAALAATVIPFIIPDILKFIAATMLGVKSRSLILSL